MDSTMVRSKRRVPVTVSASSFKGSDAVFGATKELWLYPQGALINASTMPNTLREMRELELLQIILNIF